MGVELPYSWFQDVRLKIFFQLFTKKLYFHFHNLSLACRKGLQIKKKIQEFVSRAENIISEMKIAEIWFIEHTQLENIFFKKERISIVFLYKFSFFGYSFAPLY